MKKEFIYENDERLESCHASTLVEPAAGEVLAAWFGGKEEGDPSVKIWTSRRTAAGWSKPEIAAAEEGVPCWNPVLHVDAKQRVWLFYKAGESPESWSGIYRVSTDGGRTWGEKNHLPAGLLGPIKNKPIVLQSGELVCGTSVESWRAWTCWVEILDPRTGQWSRHGPIAVKGENYGVIQPTLWELEPGHVRMLMRATRRIGVICRADSVDGGRSWFPAEPTDLPNPNAGIDAVKMKDGRIALVYNDTKSGRSPLSVALSDDGGATWRKAVELENEPRMEFSYPAVIQARNGDLMTTYTWKRRRIAFAVIPQNEVR